MNVTGYSFQVRRSLLGSGSMFCANQFQDFSPSLRIQEITVHSLRHPGSLGNIVIRLNSQEIANLKVRMMAIGLYLWCLFFKETLEGG
jgi:hypothetical protein